MEQFSRKNAEKRLSEEFRGKIRGVMAAKERFLTKHAQDFFSRNYAHYEAFSGGKPHSTKVKAEFLKAAVEKSFPARLTETRKINALKNNPELARKIAGLVVHEKAARIFRKTYGFKPLSEVVRAKISRFVAKAKFKAKYVKRS